MGGELVPVGAAVDRNDVEHVVDVGAGLRELDPDTLLAPAVDVALTRVVRGERRAGAAVLAHQLAQVPRAVADVDLGVEQVADHETVAAGAQRDRPAGLGEELHQAEGAGRGACVGTEPALGVDHGREKRRVEVVVARVRRDDRLVAQRVAETIEPDGLRPPHRERGGRKRSHERRCDDDPSSHRCAVGSGPIGSDPTAWLVDTPAVSSCITPVTTSDRDPRTCRCSRSGSPHARSSRSRRAADRRGCHVGRGAAALAAASAR